MIDEEFSAEVTNTIFTVKVVFLGLDLLSQVGLHCGIEKEKLS